MHGNIAIHLICPHQFSYMQKSTNDSIGTTGSFLMTIIASSLVKNEKMSMFDCLFDLMLQVHGKQLRSCWDCQLSNHTVPG